MSDWICKTCGTYNKDPENVPMNSLTFQYVRKLQEKRMEYEVKGKTMPENCSRCREFRP